jgi:hypothetical protein
MRPIYEKDQDRTNELAVAQLYATNGVVAVQTKKLADFDVAFLRDDRVVCVAEIKCRNNPMSAYSTYLISADKIGRLNAFARNHKVVALVIVSWSCGAVGHVTMPTQYHLAVGGRIDRNDPMDVEIVAHIPISSFTIKRPPKQ